MKKFIMFLALVLSINTALAYEFSPKLLDAVKDGQMVNYSAQNKEWSRTPLPKELSFTKYMTHGSGGFSEYKIKGSNDKIYDPNSTYEFLYNGKLYGYNVHLLKFYEITIKNGKFDNRELSKEEVQDFFANVEIVPVSKFKDNKITLKKPFFKTKAYMLFNDTNRDFYKYQFESNKKQSEITLKDGIATPNLIFRGLFEVNSPKTLIYSHFASRDAMFPILKIKIKNSL